MSIPLDVEIILYIKVFQDMEQLKNNKNTIKPDDGYTCTSTEGPCSRSHTPVYTDYIGI